MTSAMGNHGIAADLLETQGPCTTPLDAGVEYIRRRIEWMLPLYVLAMLPHAIVVAWLIDAICGERRGLVDRYCAYLVIATIWRWLWLTRMQWQVQRDLDGQQSVRPLQRIPTIILFRLLSSFAMTWGSLLLGVPSFYGFFVGSFAAPALLENDDPATLRFKQAMTWVHYSARRLLRMLIAMTFITMLLLVAILASQSVIINLVLPTLFGMNTADLKITVDSWPWRFGVLYFVFLVIDAFWTVASVFIYYDSQSRRMATDLRARLAGITGASE